MPRKLGKTELKNKLSVNKPKPLTNAERMILIESLWRDVDIPGISIAQTAHAFTVGTCIKLSGETWVKAQANNRANAGTVGLVSEVTDANHFKYIVGGLLPGEYTDGADYFLSVDTPGSLSIVTDETIWNVGEVYEFIGTGTSKGLMIEIDLGHEIVEGFVEAAFLYVAYASDINGTGFTLTNNPAFEYMAVLNTDHELVDPVVADFEGLWYRRKGDTGEAFEYEDFTPEQLAALKGDTGDDGISSYTYVSYASDAIGNGWSLTPTNSLKYRAEIKSATELTPIESDFTGAIWVKYIGDDAVSDSFIVHLIFDLAGDITYPCPYALKFTAMIHSQANAPTLDVALDTNMAQYDVLTVTADAVGIVTLTGTWL